MKHLSFVSFDFVSFLGAVNIFKGLATQISLKKKFYSVVAQKGGKRKQDTKKKAGERIS